tara:strand:- start:1796 stop:3034 length:1239 start_codon:yes stop_codon:yes gene_type:complete
MPTSFGQYYYDGTSFETSTALFTDAGLTLEAPAGTYRLGGVFRIWSGSPLTLSQVYQCDSCCQAICNYSAPFTGVFPVTSPNNFKDTICTQSRPSGIVVIEYDFGDPPFKGFPMGFDAAYDGVTYTNVSSNRYGLIQARYKGSDDWISEATLIDASNNPYTLNDREWKPLTATFQTTGTSTSETLTAASVDLKPKSPEKCYMAIPKQLSPANVDVTIYSPRPASEGSAGMLDVTVGCPAPLASFASSANKMPIPPASPTLACAVATTTKFYHVQVNGTAGVPRLFDIVYTDAGATTHPDLGYYAIGGGRWMEVGAEGVVLRSGVCNLASTLTDMIATPSAASSPSGTCALSPNVVYYHNGSADLPVATDTIYTDVAGTIPISTAGYYQLQQEYTIIEVNGSGVVQSLALYNC